MRTTLVGPLVLCLLAGPAAANVIGIGLDWRKNVFVQEYWKDGTAHYLIANRGKAPVTITVNEWKAQGAGPKLAGPWEVKAGAVLDVEAPKIKGEQFVLWQLADGTDLGLLGPPRAPAEKPGEKVATYDGLNGSGGRRFDVYCEQAKAGFPSDGTFEVKLVLSSAASARGVLTFRKKKSLDALPGDGHRRGEVRHAAGPGGRQGGPHRLQPAAEGGGGPPRHVALPGARGRGARPGRLQRLVYDGDRGRLRPDARRAGQAEIGAQKAGRGKPMSQGPTSTQVLQPPAHRPPAVRSFGRTDPGRVRSSNQDQFLIAELGRTLWVHQASLAQPQTQVSGNRGHVFLVADGMGGHRGGEVASALTLVTIEDFVLNFLRRFSNLQTAEEPGAAKELQAALQQADARIFRETSSHPELFGMGTTLTMAFASNWKLFVVHVGDSRCYLLRAGALRQVTTDHTVTAELLRRGVLNAEQAAHHQFRHVITNAVGGTESGIRVEVHKEDLEPGDVMLLCSDGLTDMLADDRLKLILEADRDPRAACDRLVNEANEQGGRDNVTALVAVFD